jgi:hypothetical protein
MPDKEEVFRKIEGNLIQMDAVDDARASNALRVLQRNHKAWFSTTVNLKMTQMQGGDYGEVFFRLYNGDEADDIMANKLYQTQSSDWTKLSKEDHKNLREWKAGLVAAALHPKMGITKEVLLQSENFAFVAYMFNFLCEFSGLGGNIVKDSLWFLQLPSRESVSQTMGSVVPQVAQRGSIPKLDGQVIGDDYGSNAPR